MPVDPHRPCLGSRGASRLVDHGAMAVEKRVATYAMAARGAATDVRFHGNAIATVELAGLEFLPRTWLGAGVVCQITLPSLQDLAP